MAFGWKEVPLFGGPKDGEVTRVRGKSREPVLRFLDPGSDPSHGIQTGDVLHVYDHVQREDGRELYRYRGTEVAT